MSASRAAAVVVGVEVNGLGVLRSLALGDVPLIAADANPRQPAMRTRHGRKLGLRALTGSELVEDLLALARSLDQRPVLFLTRDDTVKTISAHRETLAPHYRFQLPPPAITTALNTKAGFQALAQQGNFPVPPGVHVTGEADLPKLAALPLPPARSSPASATRLTTASSPRRIESTRLPRRKTLPADSAGDARFALAAVDRR
ncbi:MAG: hypothetical protein IPN66_20160 [Candidatus Competibacteraceae bacterium]|nr:hypothetical protein [Candidatus Competibacteraceae bacterium]